MPGRAERVTQEEIQMKNTTNPNQTKPALLDLLLIKKQDWREKQRWLDSAGLHSRAKKADARCEVLQTFIEAYENAT